MLQIFIQVTLKKKKKKAKKDNWFFYLDLHLRMINSKLVALFYFIINAEMFDTLDIRIH